MEFPDKGLVRLIYVSRPQITPSQRPEVVKDIVVKSISNNRLIDVTGMLLSNNELFLQVLEGPSAAVQALYEVVRQDPRHSEVKLIEFGVSHAREFRDWNMTARALKEDILRSDDLTADQALALFRAQAS